MLEAEGHLTDMKIVKRDKWDEPRRRKYAKKVVEAMEEEGQVRELWKQFREEIDSARERKSGWQRERETEF
jgi:ribosome-binding protein aMBF1 (putative translation factor)